LEPLCKDQAVPKSQPVRFLHDVHLAILLECIGFKHLHPKFQNEEEDQKLDIFKSADFKMTMEKECADMSSKVNDADDLISAMILDYFIGFNYQNIENNKHFIAFKSLSSFVPDNVKFENGKLYYPRQCIYGSSSDDYDSDKGTSDMSQSSASKPQGDNTKHGEPLEDATGKQKETNNANNDDMLLMSKEDAEEEILSLGDDYKDDTQQHNNEKQSGDKSDKNEFAEDSEDKSEKGQEEDDYVEEEHEEQGDDDEEEELRNDEVDDDNMDE
jgi:hypothetical protein